MKYKRHPFADYAESRAKRVHDAQLKIEESDLDDDTKQIMTDLCRKEIRFLWEYFVDHKLREKEAKE